MADALDELPSDRAALIAAAQASEATSELLRFHLGFRLPARLGPLEGFHRSDRLQPHRERMRGMSAADRHNALAPMLVTDLIRGTQGEAEAMVVLESVVLGVMLYYRPDPREAGEFLDTMTASVIERIRR